MTNEKSIPQLGETVTLQKVWSPGDHIPLGWTWVKQNEPKANPTLGIRCQLQNAPVCQSYPQCVCGHYK